MKRISIPHSSSKQSKCLAAICGLFILLTIGAPHLPSPQVTLPAEIPGTSVAGMNPQMCVGFDSTTEKWGTNYGLCPAHHAYYGVDDPAGVSGPAERIRGSMACCPLPSQDILTEEHVYSDSECPKEYVATGNKISGSAEQTNFSLRCTKINTARYTLGEETPGVYWGDGAAGWRGSKRITWENIPAAMRFAHGREKEDKWDVDGCVGYPWGSMLTKKESKNCASFSFKQLQYTGKVDGDPGFGSPVQMLPRCNTVKNSSSRSPQCES